ncbi:MAG TPA: sigma-70 family RNA polymerase sigma factor [Saprospiraceae bacterium]|nr:sigma-70 family RNA polymerase sigma factor [Saprospiraceae bacterium]
MFEATRHISTGTSDEVLMQHVALRDEQAFGLLYDRYGKRMYRYFYRMLWRDSAKAEDFTQELFLKLIEKPHLYDPSRAFRTWLYTLAANLCKNEYRRKKPSDLDWPLSETDWKDHFLPEELDRALFETKLREAIDLLGEAHKQCFVLRYQEALSVAEIAVIMDCPEGTIKSRLHHALQKVAGQLEFFKT